MAPVLGGSGRGGLAGFDIGIAGGGQAEFCKALLAALQHAMQCGQILAVFNSVFRALENLLHGVVRERFQPQFFDLFQLFRIREGCIVLIVIVQAKQGKDLIDRLDMGFCRQGATWLILPRRCR